ncbi:hypothetical protein OROHE_014455 [Orobanche hederae]
MAQSLRPSRSSFGSSNGFDTLSNNSSAIPISNVHDYNFDGSNFTRPHGIGGHLTLNIVSSGRGVFEGYAKADTLSW